MELYLKHVYVWQNGMVIAFDQLGAQMPEYQGRREEVWEKIQRDCRPDTVIEEDCVWSGTRL
jgi:hypothetical protein